VNIKKKIGAAAVSISLLLAGNVFAAEKWMTGDWHQHTVFTDGSNIMGDLEIDKSTTPPTFTILTHKYTNASPNFTPVREGATGKNEYKGVIPQGFRYGLDFQANSEHGGNRGARDGFGRYWVAISPDISFYPPSANIPLLGVSATYTNTCDYNNIDSPGCTSLAHQIMWRWQELANYPTVISSYKDNYMSAFDWISELRHQYRDKEILTGMEWNVPGHEHASTGCLENNGKCIAEFEFRFDNNDTDTEAGPLAAGMNWTGKRQNSYYAVANGYHEYPTLLGLNLLHNKAIEGLAWLNTNHPITSWVNPAHIERAGCGFDYLNNQIKGGYSIAAIRDMNDTAPTVFFGFEGMPGHQKASNRGEVSGTSCGGGTFGGAGTYIATVGGVWDNLLADGRKIFNFVSSDFHMTQDDFYPGEYAKTYVKVKDNAYREDEDNEHRSDENERNCFDNEKEGERHHGTFTQQNILDGMRSGNSFAVHGDLINELDFRVFHGASIKKRSDKNTATMGETLSVRKNEKITVQIRFKSPSVNNNGDIPVVHHVQLIQGQINPTKAGKFVADGVTPNPDFNKIDPNVASIVETFDASDWRVDKEGFMTMSFTVPHVKQDMFFRIRGTNLDYGVNVKDATGTKVVYGTDPSGSPLINTPGTNSVGHVWKDLWFYSNPIFVDVK
jgi:hypothetical protein